MGLDPDLDPDRFDPGRFDPGPFEPEREAPAGPLDPERDPDRFSSLTLTGLLGDGAHEEERSTMSWAIGLSGVIGFLLLVSLLLRLGNGG